MRARTLAGSAGDSSFAKLDSDGLLSTLTGVVTSHCETAALKAQADADDSKAKLIEADTAEAKKAKAESQAASSAIEMLTTLEEQYEKVLTQGSDKTN